VHVGLQLEFEFEEWASGSTVGWAEIAKIAQHAESAGFDSVWVPDHLLFYSPRGERSGMWDAWTLLAAIAAVTKKVQIGTLVSCASFRNPALLARIVSTVDVISEGRLVLGLGAGWQRTEFRAFGLNYERRITRLEETLVIVRALLAGSEVSYMGTFGQLDCCSVHPRRTGAQTPILVGGTGPRIMSLAARYADVWNADWRNNPGDVQPLLQRLDQACAEVGRDSGSLARSVGVMVDLPTGTPRPAIHESPPLTGSPEYLAEMLAEFGPLGIKMIQVWLSPCSLDGIDSFAPTLAGLH
jgi:alkanesulfonate monooxygenase SsuD/methylene tetrahydromethanopterin reductase-like flavin-dependent oxidoreductase (luciferase family)